MLETYNRSKITELENGLENGIEQGIKKGMQEGLEKGMQQGKRKSQLEIAQKLKKIKMPIEQIMELTELAEEEIKRIK